MPEQNITHTDSARLSIRSQVSLASEIVAPYWPIGTFVHHNPLHELESSHFEAAIQRGQELLGGRGYLPNEIYRRQFQAGLAPSFHVEKVLSHLTEDASVVIGNRSISKLDVYRVQLLEGISSPSQENVSRLCEQGSDRKISDALVLRLKNVFAQSKIETSSLAMAQKDIAALGKKITLVGWCDQVFGTDFLCKMNQELSRWCGAFLDEGEAGWSMPDRKSFYRAWKALSPLEPASEWGLSNWGRTITSLPERPEDAILDVLEELCIPDSVVVDYFAVHLSSLPGWSAFIKWRAKHQGYSWQEVYPSNLVQYIAIRLVYEREFVRQLCKQNLGIDGTYSAIEDFMESDSMVYFVLRQRAAGGLADNWARSVDRLSNKWDAGQIENWRTLASRYLIDQEDCQRQADLRSAAWRLSALAKCLQISQGDLLECRPENLVTLLNWLDEFPAERHGLAWLKVSEAAYQESLLNKVSKQISSRRSREKDSIETVETDSNRPQAQAIFCIDVRSEPFRRHLEHVSNCETFGFAGFFICFIRYKALESHHETDQFPVIMKARNFVREVPRPYHHNKLQRYQEGANLIHAIRELLHDLKGNVITPYVTVESLGWIYSLPLILKTLVPAWYYNASRWLKGLVVQPVSTTLTIDKLPNTEAEQMVTDNQLATIRRAVSERLGLQRAQISPKMLSTLRELALGETSSAQVLDEGVSLFPALPAGEFTAFIDELRRTYHIDERATARHKERITRTGFTLEEQVFTVETALRMLGLTTGFARIVLVCAHGSTSDNNPFESALDCGACGGNEGKANARVFATMANNVQVREAIARKQIEIPADTYFVAGQVNTTTDEVQLLDLEDVPPTHRMDLGRLQENLKEAGRLASQERCARFPNQVTALTPDEAANHVLGRSTDWSQVRPEWGLSGNAAFIVARRAITKAINMEGRTFLHSYDYLSDPQGKLLEIILTAPQVVTQWINMEHYFSTVDNDVYGSGSKIYHNVTGQIGVMSGTLSDLRTGLAWQTVMTGETPFHDPLRLMTLVEAPRAILEQIIARHEILQRFYHNEWVHLVALEREEGALYRYSPTGEWNRLSESMAVDQTVTQQESASIAV